MLSHKRREKTDLKSVNKTLHVNKTKNPHVVSSSPPFPPFLFPLPLVFFYFFPFLLFLFFILAISPFYFFPYHPRPLLSFLLLFSLPSYISLLFPLLLLLTPLPALSKTHNKQRKTNRRSGHSKKKKPLHRLRVFKIRARNAAGGGAHLLDIREKIRAFAAGPYADLESVFKIKDGRENAKFFLL